MCNSTFSRIHSDPGNRRCTSVYSQSLALQASPTELDLRNIKIYTRSFKIYGIWPQTSKQASKQAYTCTLLTYKIAVVRCQLFTQRLHGQQISTIHYRRSLRLTLHLHQLAVLINTRTFCHRITAHTLWGVHGEHQVNTENLQQRV